MFVRDLDRSFLGKGRHGMANYKSLRRGTDHLVNLILRLRRLLKQKRSTLVQGFGTTSLLTISCAASRVVSCRLCCVSPAVFCLLGCVLGFRMCCVLFSGSDAMLWLPYSLLAIAAAVLHSSELR